MTAPTASAPYWSRPVESLLEAMGSRTQGLTGEEAAARLKRDGPNTVGESGDRPALALLARQFSNPLVLILVFAALVSISVGEWIDAGIVLAMVFGSALLGFSQEYRASAAVADLRRRLAIVAKVRRDGVVAAVPVQEVVAGDVIVLSAGALIPADAVLIEANDLQVSEAALTGEAFPVEKRPGAVEAAASVPHRLNCLFLGASVRSGCGEALVVATGARTLFGAVAERLKSRPEDTDFTRGVRQLGAMLIRIMILLVLFVLTVNQLLGRPFIESLLFAVALGVGMSPELLPAIISVTLSAGASTLSRRGVIVRRLEAIENLGAMTVFCTDKTGTLTEGRIRLEAALLPDGSASADVARLGYLNAAFETGIDNPLDQAIVEAAARLGLSTDGFAKVQEIPYDFSRKRLSVVVTSDGGSPRMITKGAFDQVVAGCASVACGDGETPLDAPELERLRGLYAEQGRAGLRLLAVATRAVEPKARYTPADETGMRLEGFLVFVDPPKPEAAPVVAALAELGVAVKVISGDNRHVVAHLAEALRLPDRSLLTGEALAQLKDEALWNVARRTALFVEVDPQQKERIVRALRRGGEVVGYLGDGVNDAPALYAADVGVSVDGAVDVARESADVVLMSRELDVLRDGIVGGRRTFANTLKYICITTSANFGNVVSMALAAPVLPFLPMLPKQVLLNNFLSDIPAIAISSDRVEPERLRGAQSWRVADIQRFMVVFGLLSSVFDILAFTLLLTLFQAPAAGFQTAWFVASLLTELTVILVLRTQGPAWRGRPGALLAGLVAIMTATALAAPYLGPVSRLFGFMPLRPEVLASLIAVALAYLAATEAAKRVFFRAPPQARRAGRGFRR